VSTSTHLFVSCALSAHQFLCHSGKTITVPLPYSPDLALLSFTKNQGGITGNENDIVVIQAKSRVNA
jgi:hypothetical protein